MRHVYIALSSGFMFGICAIIIKIVMNESTTTVEIFTNWMFYVFLALSLLAFFTVQKALKHGKSSQVTLANSTTATIIPIVGGLYIGEILATQEILGIALIVISTVVLLKRK